jgi:hypothetical protein
LKELGSKVPNFGGPRQFIVKKGLTARDPDLPQDRLGPASGG